MDIDKEKKRLLAAAKNPWTWALFALTIALYWNVVPSMVNIWLTDDAYSHGVLIPFLASYVFWLGHENTFAQPSETDGRGLILVALGCAVLLAGKLGAEFFLTRISIVLLLAGGVWTFWGKARLRTMTFPLLLLATMVPIPQIIYNKLAAPLQLFASSVASNTLEVIGIPVFRDGNVMHLAEISLGVAEACSGLRSISSLSVLALVVGFFVSSSNLSRVTLFFCSFPIAIALNVVRIVGTALMARQNPALAEGFFHSFSGWVVFLLGFGVLYLTALGLAAIGGRRVTA